MVPRSYTHTLVLKKTPPQKKMHSGFCLGKAEIKYSKFLEKKKKKVLKILAREKNVTNMYTTILKKCSEKQVCIGLICMLVQGALANSFGSTS